MKIQYIFVLFAAFALGCGEGDKEKDEGERNAYSFSSSIQQSLASSSLATSSLAMHGLHALTTSQYTADGLCTSVLCFTPSAMSGEYYGAGLLIQSDGNGMSSYFGIEDWSSVTAATATLDFDLNTPLTHTGELTCCGGEGDLSSENTYFSDVSYMFAYFDVTFEIPASLGAHGDAVGTHSLRFVIADDAIANAKRGDILVEDNGAYKWMDQDGILQDTRPSTPITMNEKVVNWTNSGDKGNQTIPVMYALLNEDDGKHLTSEDELKATATYTFDFNASGFIIFPDLLHADGSMIEDRKYLLENIHIHGLPYGDRGEFGLPKAELTVSK